MVYHVHGMVNDPKSSKSIGAVEVPVLSEDDYHKLNSTGHHWSNVTILNALQHSHCVFIGLSMTDPNLRRLFQTAFYKNVPHYVFLPRNPLYEGYYDTDRRNVEHYHIQEKIMRSMGINIIWYELRPYPNEHEALYELIKDLAKDIQQTPNVNDTNKTLQDSDSLSDQL